MSAQDTIMIFLDDLRKPPSKNWEVVRTAEYAFDMVKSATALGAPIHLSLDHDLGEDRKTGYDLLLMIEKEIHNNVSFRPTITFFIHSQNPVGVDDMDRAVSAIYRALERED